VTSPSRTKFLAAPLTQSLLHHRTPTMYIWGRSIPSLQLKFPLLSKHWTLEVVMKSDLKCSKAWITKEFFGWLVCVKWPGVLQKYRKIGKLGRSSPYTEGGQEWMHQLTMARHVMILHWARCNLKYIHVYRSLCKICLSLSHGRWIVKSCGLFWIETFSQKCDPLIFSIHEQKKKSWQSNANDGDGSSTRML